MISITNPKVIDFFHRHPDLTPDSLFSSFVDIYEHILTTLNNDTQTLSSKLDALKQFFDNSQQLDTLRSQNLLSELSHIKDTISTLQSSYNHNIQDAHTLLVTKVDALKSNLESHTSLHTQTIQTELANIKTLLHSINSDISNHLNTTFTDMKTTYLQELQTILASKDSHQIDHLKDILQARNAELITSTSNLLVDTVPQLQQHNIATIQSSLQNILTDHTQTLLTNIPSQSSFSSLADTLSNKFNDITQTIFTTVHSTESKLSHTLSQLNQQHSTSSQQLGSIIELFNKSSNKGSFSENIMSKVLSRAFPSAEISETSQIPKSCDFRIKRNDRIDILIENKDFSVNVPLNDIKKFHRDIEFQDSPGILVSQFSGISNKPHFHIEIHHGNPIIYIHNLNYNHELLQLAVNVIDNLTDKLQTLTHNDKTISVSSLNHLNNELRTFLTKRQDLVNYLRDTNKLAIEKIKDLQLPALEQLLSSHFASNNPPTQASYTCSFCPFSSSSQNSLNAHVKHCKSKPPKN